MHQDRRNNRMQMTALRAAADAERGRLVAEHAASRFLDLCAEVADYPAETIGVPARAASVQQG